QRCLMPRGPELPAAADVGNRDGAAAAEPGLTGIERLVAVVPVPGRERKLEAAIAVEDRRNGAVRLLRPDEEIWHLRAVPGGRPVLMDGEAAPVEHGRLRLDERRRAATAVGIKRWWSEEALEAEVGLRTPVVGRDDGGRAAARQSEAHIAPARLPWPKLADRPGDVFVDRGVDRVAPGRDLIDHRMRSRGVENRYRLRAA